MIAIKTPRKITDLSLLIWIEIIILKWKKISWLFQGIVKRFEPIDKSKEDDNLKFRLRKLNRLQCMLLEHAASFPNVQRIVSQHSQI